MKPIETIIEENDSMEDALAAMREEINRSSVKLSGQDQVVILDQMILSVALNLLGIIFADASDEVREEAKDEFQQWATFQRMSLTYQVLSAKRKSMGIGGGLIVPENS